MSAKVCPQCGRRYEGDQRFCSIDGSTLIPEGSGEALIGHTLAGRYAIKKKLGEGGMGEVYLAEHVKMKRKVAVKLMRGNLAKDPAAIGRFYREAENASQISHPNVAAVYDFGDQEGVVYLAMEFVDGEPLTTVLQRERVLTHVRVADIVSQTADALSAAHALGILHRDLKPDNIMVGKTRSKTDLVKLLDFGISRMIGRETQNLTSTGLIVGTPEYMSPEQLSGDQLDARADIYALGLIAFRMLTGEGAFGGTGQDILVARMTRPPRRLSEVRADVPWPAALQDTMDNALATDPASRYAEAEVFAADFAFAVSQLPPTPESEAYRAALGQRGGTPGRGVNAVDPTPTAGVAAISLTPPAPMAALSATPPMPIPAVQPTPVTPAPAIESAPPAAAPVAEERPRTPISIVVEDPLFSESSKEYRVPDELPTPSKQTPVKPRPAIATPGEVTAPVPMAAILDAGEAARAAAAAELRAADGVETATLSATSGDVPAYTGGAASGAAPELVVSTPVKRRTPLIVGGVAGVIGIAVLVAMLTKGSGTPAAASSAVTDSARTPDSTAAPNVIPAGSAPSAAVADSARPDRGMSLDAVRRASEKSVFRVIGSGGQGAGFLASSQGLVLTSASLLGQNDTTATVLIDGAKRLGAQVLRRDRSGVAALRVSMKACDKCAPLALARDSVGLVPNDSVIAIGAPSLSTSARVSRGAVTARDSATGRVSTSLRASGSVVGGPVLSTRGVVVGVARSGAALATIASVSGFLNDVSGAMDRALPSALDTLLPSWSSRPVDDAVLAKARERKEDDIRAYRMEVGDFAVLVMTPQVIAWRRQLAANARNAFNPAAPCHTNDPVCDPIEAWPAWADYVSERRNVVIVQVAPKNARPPNLGSTGTALDFVRGDFYSLELKRNGVPLPVLESTRLDAVANRQAYLTAGKRLFHTGVYVFRIEDFAGGQPYDLSVYDEANNKRQTSRGLPGPLLAAILADRNETGAR